MGIFSGIATLFGAGLNAYNAYLDRNIQVDMFNANMRDNARNRRFQSEEAEKQRKFNSSEAALARQFASEQADKAYARNSYSSQVAQMKAAGLNPALAYGGASFQPMANVEGPSASSSASPSGNAGASGSLTPFGFDAMSVARQVAEIDNIKAQTKKTESETEGQDLENKWIDLKNKATVDSLNMSVTVGDSVKKLNEAQFETLTKNLKTIELQWEELREKINLLKAQITGTNLDNELKDIEKRFKTPYMEAIIGKISAETNLSKFEVFRGMKLLTLEALNLQADTKVKEASFWHIGAQTAKTNAETGLVNLNKIAVGLSNEKLDLELKPSRVVRKALDNGYNNSYTKPVSFILDAIDYTLGRSVGQLFK